MPYTYTADRPQQRQFAMVASAVQLLLLAAMIAAILWGTPWAWLLAFVIVVTLVPTLLAWQQTRMHTTVSEAGVDVYDGFHTRHLPWEQLDAVGKHEKYDHVVAMRHTDGSDVVLPGVHASDVAELRAILEEHRSAPSPRRDSQSRRS